MKQFINTLAITLVFLTSISTYASREFKVEVNQNQVLSIKINNINKADKLVLSDGSEVLFEDKSLFQPYFKNISLENLPEGYYSLSLEDDYMISTKSISKTKNGISISETSVAFKPHFKQIDADARKLRVGFTNPTMQPTQFKVYDKNGNLIITLKNNDAVFNKTLDFSEVPSGDYTVAINNNGRNYYRNITIE